MKGLQPIQVYGTGMMMMVKYPYRISPDVYVTGGRTEEQKVNTTCCQCDVTMPISDLFDHIHSHDRRQNKAPMISRDEKGKTIMVKGFNPRLAEAA